ncbi:MAG: hypothetical protein HKO66_04755 [Saprospiraceae bacterium]|nr:hypothetical protein [Saprospiraceae bacterium]NNL91521.1 hypothetical protein [Saprospiraceae bacterium]
MKKNILCLLATAGVTFVVILLIFFQTGSFMIGERIEFATKGGEYSFMCMPSKGRDYKMMLRSFEDYKKKNDLTDIKIYRVTSKNYLNIGAWARYKFLPEWHHPFLYWWQR